MSRKSKLTLITMVFILAFAQVAFAGLTTMGPVNPVASPGNGFPAWYTDANGVTVELPLPPIMPLGNLVTPPTMIYAPVIAGNAYSAQTGFGAEAFYFNAIDNKNFNFKDGKGSFLLGLEAGYAGGANPAAGQQVVFARIRCIASTKTPGTYTFFHPWGSETITVTATDVLKQPSIKFTKDIGISPGWITNPNGTFTLVASPGGFNQVVVDPNNTMSTFLRQAAPAPPAGWIGDGVSPCTVTGSPIGYNKVRLQGPAGVDLDGRGNNFVEVTQMIVSGHIPPALTVPMPLSLDRVTCSFIKSGTTSVEHINVWLTSSAGAAVQIKDAVSGAILFNGSVTSPTGKFFADFPGTSTAVTVTVSAAGFTSTSATQNVIDYVNITGLTYSLGTNVLSVTGTSSDWFKHPTTPPVLTVVGFLTPTGLPQTLTFDTLGTASASFALTAPVPPTVTVNSSVGGSDTASVGIIP